MKYIWLVLYKAADGLYAALNAGRVVLDSGVALNAVPPLTVSFVIAVLDSDISLTNSVDLPDTKAALDSDTFLTNVGECWIDVYDLLLFVE